MKKTVHSQARMKQRGISELQRLLLIHFGEYHLQKGGTNLVNMPYEQIAALRQAIDRLDKVTIVITEDAEEITVMHQVRRIRHTELVA